MTANGKLARDRLPAPDLAARRGRGRAADRRRAHAGRDRRRPARARRRRRRGRRLPPRRGQHRRDPAGQPGPRGPGSCCRPGRCSGCARSRRSPGSRSRPVEAVAAAPESSLVTLTGDERDELAASGVAYAEVLPLTPLQAGPAVPRLARLRRGRPLHRPDDVRARRRRPRAARAAGQAVLDRHANLRAGYRFLRSGRAVAVVERGVRLPWTVTDLATCERRTPSARPRGATSSRARAAASTRRRRRCCGWRS